jgi:Transposase DDE domain group 1
VDGGRRAFGLKHRSLRIRGWLNDLSFCNNGGRHPSHGFWIKFHKAQLASDRTSCRRAVANQVRLVLHTAAYWLMLALRETVPTMRDLAKAEFATLRLRLLKIAVRVQETTSRIRLAYASGCPQAGLFRSLAYSLAPRPRAASP